MYEKNNEIARLLAGIKFDVDISVDDADKLLEVLVIIDTEPDVATLQVLGDHIQQFLEKFKRGGHQSRRVTNISQLRSLLNTGWMEDNRLAVQVLQKRDKGGFISTDEKERYDRLRRNLIDRYGEVALHNTNFFDKWSYTSCAHNAEGRNRYLSSLENFYVNNRQG